MGSYTDRGPLCAYVTAVSITLLCASSAASERNPWFDALRPGIVRAAEAGQKLSVSNEDGDAARAVVSADAKDVKMSGPGDGVETIPWSDLPAAQLAQLGEQCLSQLDLAGKAALVSAYTLAQRHEEARKLFTSVDGELNRLRSDVEIARGIVYYSIPKSERGRHFPWVVEKPWQEAFDAKGGYLAYVKAFAETLMAAGRDQYGKVHSPMFCSMLNLVTHRMPMWEEIRRAPGVRDSDRALCGGNLYHDGLTLRALYRLTELTSDERYQQAADAYMQYFMEHCPDPLTGLFAWGEHAYWDFVLDMRGSRHNNQCHEMLLWTPLYPELWPLNEKAVRDEVEGIYKYHFFEWKDGDPLKKASMLFNRHARLGRAVSAQFPKEPGRKWATGWMAHTGAYCYAFMFLYTKTGEERYLDWAKQMAHIFWSFRDPKTGIVTGGVIGRDENGKIQAYPSGFGAQPHVAWWLMRAYALAPKPELRLFLDRGVAYLEAYAKHRPPGEKAFGKVRYGGGRNEFVMPQAALCAFRLTDDVKYLRLAESYAKPIMLGPQDMLKPDLQLGGITAECFGRGIEVLCGVYEGSDDKTYLDAAQRLADFACQHLFYNGLFRGAIGYDVYEGIYGVGDLVYALEHLHVLVTKHEKAGEMEWVW